MIALSENRPAGWIWEYNEGARRSGYDRQATVGTWEIGEVFEQTSAVLERIEPSFVNVVQKAENG